QEKRKKADADPKGRDRLSSASYSCDSCNSWLNSPANPLPVNNRTALHLLHSLQYLEMQGEARRLSFRSLDIEQIGHVYEGLLDHTAKRGVEPVLGLVGTKGREPQIPLSALEEILATEGTEGTEKAKQALIQYL